MKNQIFPTLLSFFLLFFLSCSSDSGEETPEPDTQAPIVDFSIAGSPSGSTGPIVVSNEIIVNVDAQDNGTISKVEAFIDNQKQGEDTTAPFQIRIDVSGFESKIRLTQKFRDYTLKVSVTDAAGNVTSKEQTINIDNLLPSITEVSLEEGTVINGDSNMVTFNVSDNEGLVSVIAYLNNEVVQEFDTEVYELNINTLALSDGQNLLRLEAKDLADNTAAYSVNFISDNTGPEISIDTLEENQILDNLLNIKPNVSDEYSQAISLEVLFRGEQIQLYENPISVEFDFNPENYPTGDAVFSFVATDNLGNQSILEIDTEVLRLLMEVTLPEGFLSQFWTSFWIFASNSDDGSMIVSKSVELGEDAITLYAPGEFTPEQKYMITYLAVENTPDGAKSRVTNIQDISRNSLSQMVFNLRPNNVGQLTQFDTNGFGLVESVSGDGEGYAISHFPSEQNPNMNIFDRDDSISRDYYYLYSSQLTDIDYAYYKLTLPVDGTFSLNRSDMITDIDLETPTFSIVNALEFSLPVLNIDGYDSPQDFSEGIFHRIYSQTPPLIFGGVYQYYLNNSFSNYSHTLAIGDYYTIRRGVPPETYTVPDWTISNIQTGNTLSLTTTGADHRLGRILLRPTSGDSYVMTVLFDSQNTSEIVFPDLPDDLSDLDFYAANQEGTLNVEQIQITSFDNISTYEEYLDTVIKNQKEHDNISDIVESKLSVTGGFFNFENFHFN
ncbi:Ig-like domain-containing protein [Flagellimonas allohymeniacidonis]|uniref:Cadherin domain-containing protein n=1 Tax=Flagellimonas allohymeniacidonis TaxID=2517819 RepID=A0A4Q8QG95_9FLAO|nr:Ig-like domain-containing protein [Allomuricauda hymeniacidonis]TAI48238.1 hypothetical protein EW142_00030 [Allomuricauda hymeniacidonis]